MNTKLTDESIAAMMRKPERFLLVGPDEGWCKQARAKLQKCAEQLPGSFLAWRLEYKLLCVLPVDALEGVLQQVLELGEGQQPNVLRIWTTQSRQAWRDFAKDSKALSMLAAREATLSLIDADKLPLDEIAEAANQPDVLARLNWLLEGRTCPVSREWLALAPLPELTKEKNAAMAQAGDACYNAWAQALLDSYGADVLEELWGLSADTEGEDTAEDEAVGEDVPPAGIPVKAPVAIVPGGLADYLSSYSANDFNYDEELPLAAASHPGQQMEKRPVRVWELESAKSHGIQILKAYIEDKTIEFEACVDGRAWEGQNSWETREAPICLVLLLPGPARPVVLKRSDNRKEPGIMRFTWPVAAWPEGWLEWLNAPLGGWSELNAKLSDAQVAVM
ncbi:hypothetical protein CO610_02120 [Lysobacteraceae bacterium NML95-0200]|nr:hypothetical protein CO610_02120 [Xanthomonadaceae bacterium NML95-0200]